MVNIIVKLQDGQMALEKSPVPPIPEEYQVYLNRDEDLKWKKGAK